MSCATLFGVAKIGELVPAKSREESGAMKGKGGKVTLLPFTKPTLAAYRKVKSNEARIDDYYQARSTEAQEDTPAPTRAGEPPGARRAHLRLLPRPHARGRAVAGKPTSRLSALRGGKQGATAR